MAEAKSPVCRDSPVKRSTLRVSRDVFSATRDSRPTLNFLSAVAHKATESEKGVKKRRRGHGHKRRKKRGQSHSLHIRID